MMKKCAHCASEYQNGEACPVCGCTACVDVQNGAGDQPPAPPRPQYGYNPQQQYGRAQEPARLPEADGDLSIARSNSTAALVCGVLGFIIPLAGIVLAIIAIVLGNSARKRLPAAERTVASAGFTLGIAALIYSIILLIVVLWVVGVLLLVSSSYMDPWSYGYDVPYYW